MVRSDRERGRFDDWIAKVTDPRRASLPAIDRSTKGGRVLATRALIHVTASGMLWA